MTREEAKKECQIYESKIGAWYMDVGNYPKKTSTDILDEIFDDVKSRTCENCKFGDGDTEGTMICRHPDDAMPFHVPLDFGCVPPYFERKEK